MRGILHPRGGSRSVAPATAPAALGLLALALYVGLGAGPAAAQTAARPDPGPPRTLVLQPAGDSVPDAGGPGSILFVGTATVILRFAGFTILTDPNFLHKGEHVHLGYGLTSARLTDPALRLEDLPPVDLVLLSHFHEDHFDKRVQAGLDRNLPLVSTTEAVGALRKLGFRRLEALARWQSLEVSRGPARLRITAMPARHGPPVVAEALPDTMGSMLEFQVPGRAVPYRIYISGDTLVFDDLAEIPKRYPDVDLALLHLGGTRAAGVLVTMDAEQGVQALRIIDPDLALPIHYDDYDVFKSPLKDFVRAVEAAGLQQKVRYLKRGETFEFGAAPVGPAAAGSAVR